MYARIQDGTVTDVRQTHPKDYFVEAFAAQFVVIPDHVENGWTFDGSEYTAPPAPYVPSQEELDAIAAAESARVLTAARANLIRQIDADTDAIYRAVQGDRAMEYVLAESDAKAYKSAGYTGTVPDSVASWASAKGETATWATDDILTTARGWRQAQSSIRATRLTCKERARVESDLAPIAAAWAGFAVAIKTALGV